MMGAAGGAVSDPFTETGGEIWGWGKNSGGGALGDGTETDRSSPVQVGDQDDWIFAGGQKDAGCGVKDDGTLWVWGYNASGVLGLDDTTSRCSPTQVGALADWFYVDGGQSHFIGIKHDGTLWSWGANGEGQLGLGDTTKRCSPVQVGSLTDWKGNTTAELLAGYPMKLGVGYTTSFVIKDDGTLWGFGQGGSGMGGWGDTANKSSPVQIGSLTNWKSITKTGPDSVLATKTDGTLWSWGNGTDGPLGHGNETSLSSPVQIGSLTTWARVASGSPQASYGIKTDGTLWSWGKDYYGSLGHSNTTNYSSPVQVGSLTDWRHVQGGFAMSVFVKTNGTLWTVGAGAGTYGQLGNNQSSTNESSPIQIGSATDWGPILTSSHGYTRRLQRAVTG